MNTNLVKGDALANAAPEQTWDEALAAGFNEGNEALAAAAAERKATKRAINQKVAGYMDGLGSGVDVTELTPEQQKSVTNFLVKERGEYAAAASEIARIEDPTSPRYIELRDKMNGVSQSFKNLSSQLKSYKDEKANYLKDFDNKLISDGNEVSILNQSANLYTDQAELGIGAGGSLVFWNDKSGNYDSYNKMPKPFLKDYSTADAIIKMNKQAYNTGYTLSGARENMMRQQLNSTLSKGGRNTLLSMATDDFIIEGGLGLQDESLFEPGNEDALKTAVLDGYMNVLKDSAAQGANDKRPASGRGSGGLSGATKDEVNTHSGVQDDAYSFSELGGDMSSAASILNANNPRSTKQYISKGNLYNIYLEGKNLEDNAESVAMFEDEVGNYPLYLVNPNNPSGSRGVNLDANDPYALYSYYLDQTDLSKKAKTYYLKQYKNKGSKPVNPNITSQELINKYKNKK